MTQDSEVEEPNTRQIHVRITESAYQALRAVARAEHRTLGGQARMYIEAGLAAAGNPQSVEALESVA